MSEPVTAAPARAKRAVRSNDDEVPAELTNQPEALSRKFTRANGSSKYREVGAGGQSS